jgi:hypothetical protein
VRFPAPVTPELYDQDVARQGPILTLANGCGASLAGRVAGESIFGGQIPASQAP